MRLASGEGFTLGGLGLVINTGGVEMFVGGGWTELEELASLRLSPLTVGSCGGGGWTELEELASPRLCPLTLAVGSGGGGGSEEEEEAEEK